MITPNIDDFNRINKLCLLLSPIRSINQILIYSGAEEVVLFIFWICYKKTVITLLGAEYNIFSGSIHRWYKINTKIPRILHFAVQKPWLIDRFEYFDTIIWWQMFHNMILDKKVNHDGNMLNMISKLSIKLESPITTVIRAKDIITEGLLYDLFCKINFSNKHCVFCALWNSKIPKTVHIDANHIMHNCKYIGKS